MRDYPSSKLRWERLSNKWYETYHWTCGPLIICIIIVVAVGLIPSCKTMAAHGWVMSGNCISSCICEARFGSSSFCRRIFHMVCRAGLSNNSLLLHAVYVIFFGLLGAALHSSSPGFPRISEVFPWLLCWSEHVSCLFYRILWSVVWGGPEILNLPRALHTADSWAFSHPPFCEHCPACGDGADSVWWRW
jgi:hypothetical protein